MAAEHTALPPPELIAEAASLNVFDDAGKEVSFGSIIKDQKTIVVFIRHFFCGSCQQYVMQLASVRKDALEAANARLVIIGCGDWKLIKNYCQTTDFKGPMYADPSRKLYSTLGLVQNLDTTPAGQEKRSYLGRSIIGNVLHSLWQGPLKNPQHVGKQGNISQNGGEFIFGPGETCTYASRMRHTEDHVEVEDLVKEAGVAYP
ncbi:AhpC/TSA antioxidant enzyme-domain-containing protein [Cerioporus squamosus]|nr:AhpC/TSA antioxidant enzyme-domain-containing protein [Cerioporus squamosus]